VKTPSFASIGQAMVPLVVALGLIVGWALAGTGEGPHVASAAERAAIELEAAWPGASGR
jgi:hypothetical protein